MNDIAALPDIAGSQPDEPKTLAEAAYRRLRRDIIEGIHPPGEKLRVEHLKDHYAVGAGTLREALQLLVTDALVVAQGQRGFRVAPISLDDFEDITRTRVLLETAALQQSIECGDDAWEAEILARAHMLSKLEAIDASEQMLDEWDQRHQAFHSAIVAGCGSQYLLQMRERLFDLAARYRFIWLRKTVLSVEMLEDKHDQHQTLTEAILARDAARASELMRQHLLTPIPIIQQAMSGKLLTQ